MTRTAPPRVRLAAPYPWFGGKRRVAGDVWSALGDPRLYVEPFAGSVAVLLARPAEHVGGMEVAGDMDGMLVNALRCFVHAPEALVDVEGWPATNLDLTAWVRWLRRDGAARVEALPLADDPKACDPEVAAAWLYVQTYAWGTDQRMRSDRPTFDALPSHGVRAVDFPERVRWMGARLRHVSIVAADWRKPLRAAVSRSNRHTVGVFLDPPYHRRTGRDPGLYRVDDGSIADEVAEWCRRHEDRERLRIVLAGLEGEHELPGWRQVSWTGVGGFAAQGNGAEVLWISPSCDAEE